MPITALPTPPSRADAVNFSDRADAFLLALPGFVTEANALAVAVNNASAAASAAATSAVNAPGTNGTSTSAVAVGTGSKGFTTQAGKAWTVGQFVLVADYNTLGANWMHGQITAYAGTALTVNVLATGGGGTPSTWNISIAGPYVPASAAEIRACTATNSVITPAAMMAALADVTIADAATITPVTANFINAVITLGGNRTLANPTVTAAEVGKSGRIKIIQDGTGNRLLSFGSNWLFDGGNDFILSTTAGAVDYLYYDIESTTRIILSTKKGVA
ncbi:hypothetical protein O4H52_01125 [Sphingomonadaceae bacterium G21617-S1]|nr:hypothetical protein [Sphingomonadaceae bacterium G21617-S1]